MKIEATREQTNTLRAAFDAHWDRVQSAIVDARRRKDEDHIEMLRAELANINEARKALVSA